MYNQLARSRGTAIDVMCLLMIGFGFGGLGMYYYAVKHPQDIIQAQPHVLIAPQEIEAGKTKLQSGSAINEI
jgi:predicted alpha/beta-fold hydrolase